MFRTGNGFLIYSDWSLQASEIFSVVHPRRPETMEA